MIDLARENPAFRPIVDAALIGQPEALLLTEFAGDDRDAEVRSLKRLVELMADLGKLEEALRVRLLSQIRGIQRKTAGPNKALVIAGIVALLIALVVVGFLLAR